MPATRHDVKISRVDATGRAAPRHERAVTELVSAGFCEAVHGDWAVEEVKL